MKKALLLTVLLFSSVSNADGLGDPKFYESNGENKHKDINYWSGFDAHPCRYNLGYNEKKCREPGSRFVYVPYEDNSDYRVRHNENVQSVPEPSQMLMFGSALIAFAAYKKRSS